MEEEESSVLSLNGHLRPSLSVGVFKFPTSPGLSSSRARLHSVQAVRDKRGHVQPTERGYHVFYNGGIPYHLFT